MRSIPFANTILLALVGILWFGAVSWFVFSSNQWGIFLFLFAGIFISLAFLFSAFMLHRSNQAFGMPALYAVVAIAITANAFNHQFLEIEIVHNITLTVVMSLLFFLAIVKIWDTLEYWGEGAQ